MDDTLSKNIRDDLIIFKNETLKDIKQTEKTLLDKYKEIEFTIMQKIDNFEQHFNKFNKKIIEMSSFIEGLRDVSNNINSLTSFKARSENTLIDLDIKLKALDKDSHNSIFNIENILKSSVVYPGVIGTTARFKTFHAFIDHILSYISQFKQFRDKIEKEVNTNRINAENSLSLLKVQLDATMDKTQAILNNEITYRDEQVKSELKLYDDKLRNFRMDNAKCFEDVRDDIEKIRIRFNDKFDDINGKKDELFFKYNVLEGICNQNTNDIKTLKDKDHKINNIINEINYKIENINKEIEDNNDNQKDNGKNKNNSRSSLRMLSVRQDFRKSRFKQYEIGSRDSIKKGSFKRDSNRSIESQKYNNDSQNNENIKIFNGWAKSQSYKRFSLFSKNNINMQNRTINTEINSSGPNFLNNNNLGNKKGINDSKRSSIINLSDKSTYSNLNSKHKFDKTKQLKSLALNLEGEGNKEDILSLDQKININYINNKNAIENNNNNNDLKKKKNSFISGFPRIVTNQGERIIVCSHPVYHRDKFTNIVNTNILSAYKNIQNIQKNKKESKLKLNKNDNSPLNIIINEPTELEENNTNDKNNKIINVNYNNEIIKGNNFFKTSISPKFDGERNKKEINDKTKNNSIHNYQEK